MDRSNDTPRMASLLLVDDDRLILATLAAGLRHMGYQVAVADSVDAAQMLLDGGLCPDLAIVDVHLPGRDGLSLAQRLAELDQVPFLMLSAFSDAATVERVTRSGALGYLVKPLALLKPKVLFFTPSSKRKVIAVVSICTVQAWPSMPVPT